MPRRTANPDSMVVEYQRRTAPHHTFEIAARRDGSYSVQRGDKVYAARGPQLSSHLGASKYPSNRLQAEAIDAAKARVEAMLLSDGD